MVTLLFQTITLFHTLRIWLYLFQTMIVLHIPNCEHAMVYFLHQIVTLQYQTKALFYTLKFRLYFPQIKGFISHPEIVTLFFIYNSFVSCPQLVTLLFQTMTLFHARISNSWLSIFRTVALVNFSTTKCILYISPCAECVSFCRWVYLLWRKLSLRHYISFPYSLYFCTGLFLWLHLNILRDKNFAFCYTIVVAADSQCQLLHLHIYLFLYVLGIA